MYTYVSEELPALIFEHFPADATRQGISGHSMGGHGALVLALRNPGRFRSVSAFAPIVAPSEVPWGCKAFEGYLGPERESWAEYDATLLLPKSGWDRPILIDQGEADPFLEDQLRPERFASVCRDAGVPLELRRQPGYDHSYYFIATFIGDHIAHHARFLNS
jgi:S-formylglutathione hydrolase